MFYIITSFDGRNKYSDENDEFMTDKEQGDIAQKLQKLLLTGDKYLKIAINWKAKNIFYLEIIKRDLNTETSLFNEIVEKDEFNLKSLFDYLIEVLNRQIENSANSVHQDVLDP